VLPGVAWDPYDRASWISALAKCDPATGTVRDEYARSVVAGAALAPTDELIKGRDFMAMLGTRDMFHA